MARGIGGVRQSIGGLGVSKGGGEEDVNSRSGRRFQGGTEGSAN